jgi:hypothetical protein
MSKWLDRFFIFEALLETGFLFNSSVAERGILYHRPITLRMKGGMDSPPTPLKFNHVWLEEEDFREMVKNLCHKLNPLEPHSMMK